MTCELCIIASNGHGIQSELAAVWSIIFSYLEILQENYLANKSCLYNEEEASDQSIDYWEDGAASRDTEDKKNYKH